jgi:endonuclease G
MMITQDIVASSVARLKRTHLDPTKADQRLGPDARRKLVSGRQRDERFRELLTETEDAVVARSLLERVIEGNDLVGINYLSIGTFRARSVCRIHLRDQSGRTVGFGTGFLVAPGVVMTNHHVIASAEEARSSLAEFDYEYDAAGIDKAVVTFALRVDLPVIPVQGLDFCLVAVAPRSVNGKTAISDFGWVPLNPTPGKAFVGEYLTIVQHPGGERKQVCVRENKLIKYDENARTLWYKTDTVAGSSGSPVFNQAWQVVALHHSGVPATDAKGRWLTVDGQVWTDSMDETRVKWIANEGVRISSICEYLKAQRSDQPLARAVLQAARGAPTPSDVRTGRPPEASFDGWSVSSDAATGEMRVTIPVQIAVRVGPEHPVAHAQVQPSSLYGAEVPALPLTPIADPRLLLQPLPVRISVPSGVETVKIDQKTYGERPGYDPHFLGKGALAISLPKVARPALAKQVLHFGVKGKQTTELPYWNYSVVMNKARRLAFFSMVNVDASRRPAGAGRDGDRWYLDTRIDEKYQLGADFYGKQQDLEIDRSLNPFDRGHLTRRLDAQWGPGANQAKRNGDDSFHWTNCSPQHWKFNQGAKRWLGLEDYVIQAFAHDAEGRATVINGPVFDAPPSGLDGSSRVVPKLDGAPRKDPTFGGVAIPKLFFKIVACSRSDGSLGAAGFLMSQEDLLANVDRLTGMDPPPDEMLTDAEAKLYQVRLADIARLTGLDLGALAEAEVDVDETLVRPLGARRIEELEDIRV